jgi:hypothetical protein
MFVRFRQTKHRLQLSLVETRRIDGRVRHEHIASLGSIENPPTAWARTAFWQLLHERLAKLSNRVDPATQGRILGAVHERIPMVTPDEQRSLQLENAKAEEQFWMRLHELYEQRVEGQQKLVAGAESVIGRSRSASADAVAHAAAIKERIGRIEKGETVPGGLGRPMTRADVIALLGWTKSDERHAQRLAEMDEDAFEEFLEECHKRARAVEKAASNAVLRRRR